MRSVFQKPRFIHVLLAAFLAGSATFAALPPAHASTSQVLVTVNDLPITTFDVTQRIALWKLVGGKPSGATDAEIDKRIDGISKSLKVDAAGFKVKLKSQGVSVAAMRQYISAQFAFHRLVRATGSDNLTVTDDEIRKRTVKIKSDIDNNIDQQIAKIESDPRRKAVTVYQILSIDFPIDAQGGEITGQLVQSRAMEVNQFISRFKGCKAAKEAASGIFDVKVGRMVEADATKIPKQLKDALDSVKPGKALGPIRADKGLQALAFCGVRKIVPPKVKRPTDIKYPGPEQVRGLLEQEKFDAAQAKYRGEWRKDLMIEYRDPSLNQ